VSQNILVWWESVERNLWIALKNARNAKTAGVPTDISAELIIELKFYFVKFENG